MNKKKEIEMSSGGGSWLAIFIVRTEINGLIDDYKTLTSSSEKIKTTKNGIENRWSGEAKDKQKLSKTKQIFKEQKNN